jgi:hypothetical protein
MKILPAIILSLSLSSCALFQSKQDRAQHKLAKAISLDPTILQSSIKDSVRIKDSVHFTDSIRLKDSINITTKDSVIIIPKSDLNGDIESPCDSLKGLKSFDYRLGSGVHKLHIWSDGKRIRYSSSVDSLVSIIHSKDTYTQQLKDSFSIKEQYYLKEIEKQKNSVVTIVKHQPTLWQTLKRLGIGVLIGLIIGFVGAKLTKFKLGFLGL